MKAIKNFNEFIKENIAKKQSIDKSRANFLINEAGMSFATLLELFEKMEQGNQHF